MMTLVAWKKVCQPKWEGGFRLRKMKPFNEALLAKLGWRILNNDKASWVQICKHKYLQRKTSRFRDNDPLVKGSTF